VRKGENGEINGTTGFGDGQILQYKVIPIKQEDNENKQADFDADVIDQTSEKAQADFDADVIDQTSEKAQADFDAEVERQFNETFLTDLAQFNNYEKETNIDLPYFDYAGDYNEFWKLDFSSDPIKGGDVSL